MQRFKIALLVAQLLVSICLPLSAQDGCMRGDAQPMFPNLKPGPIRHSFVRKSRTEANEDLWLSENFQVQIRHTGCEYFVLVLRIESRNLLKYSSPEKASFLEAAMDLLMLNRLQPSIPFKLNLISRRLQELGESMDAPRFGVEYSVAGDGVEPLEARVKVSSIRRETNLSVVELTLSKGPL